MTRNGIRSSGLLRSLVCAGLFLVSIAVYGQTVCVVNNEQAILCGEPGGELAGVFASEDSGIFALAVYEPTGDLFWIDGDGRVYRGSADGGAAALVFELSETSLGDRSGGAAVDLKIAGDRIYVLGSTTLLSYGLDGTNGKVLVSETDEFRLNPHRLAATEDGVCWVSRKPRQVRGVQDLGPGYIRCLGDDGRPVTVVHGPESYFAEGIAIVGDHVYWAASLEGTDGQQLYRAQRLAGDQTPETVVEPLPADVAAMVADGERLFMASFDYGVLVSDEPGAEPRFIWPANALYLTHIAVISD